MGASKIVCKWLLMILKNCPSCAATKPCLSTLPGANVAFSSHRALHLSLDWVASGWVAKNCQSEIRVRWASNARSQSSILPCACTGTLSLTSLNSVCLSSDWRAKEMKMLWKLTTWIFAPSQLKEALISGIGRLFTNWKIIKMVLRTVKNLIHL